MSGTGSMDWRAIRENREHYEVRLRRAPDPANPGKSLGWWEAREKNGESAWMTVYWEGSEAGRAQEFLESFRSPEVAVETEPSDIADPSEVTVQTVLSMCSASGSMIHPPKIDEIRIPPAVFAKFKSLMTDNLAVWKGGKTWSFQVEGDASEFLLRLRGGERPKFRRDWHYFPTPAPVVEYMATVVMPNVPGKYLEPSAGRGSIILGVNAMFNLEHDWTVIEPEPSNRKFLEEIGFPPDHDDFDTFETPDRFARVYANPPFRHDARHLEGMIGLTAAGGSVACVLPANFRERNRKLMEGAEAAFDEIQWMDFPAGTFSKEKTQTATGVLALKHKKP